VRAPEAPNCQKEYDPRAGCQLAPDNFADPNADPPVAGNKILLFDARVPRATAAGELLIEAKEQIPRGGCLPWLRENCTISERIEQLRHRVPNLLITNSN
jgi:hypothetical protein